MVSNEEVIQNIKDSLEMYSQTELRRLVSDLTSIGLVAKTTNLFNSDAILVEDKTDKRIIFDTLDSNFTDTFKVIDSFEINKLYKYGTMFYVNSIDGISEDFFLPFKLENEEITTPNTTLHMVNGRFILKIIQILHGVKLGSNNEPIRYTNRYPMIAIFHPESKIVEIKVHTISSVLQNEERDFYHKKIAEVRTGIETQLGVNLEPVDLYTLTNFNKKKKEDGVKVSSQKMELASGGNATLDSGVDSEEIILPILGELIKIIDDNANLFSDNDTSLKIKDLLEEFISETIETSELPWMSLRWPNQVKAKSIQVKFIFNHYSSYDYTMMQFYNNSRGMEGMGYVADYLIQQLKKLSSGSSDS